MNAPAAVSVLGLQVPLQIVVLGVVTGMTYALLAVGLVLAYKSSRVVNFAHGEMGALAAGIVPVLVVSDHVNYWVAVLLALLLAAATGLFMEVGVIRKFARAIVESSFGEGDALIVRGCECSHPP